ncbi:hypothetical protein [Chitinolyticbacter meiyuanensis]|uniref:hypothetical protein n=1 Tax=Chitinolyticbacter meiyuanensis TaxID=682798 RepID=UPI0011E5C70A|nr:hypothetical protein [Chitinolyticbacter meiyuanensis]
MPSVNEKLQDALINHQVDLQQLSNAEVRKIVALLNRVDKELAAALEAAVSRMDKGRFTVRYMAEVLKSVRELNAQAYASVGEVLEQDLEELAEYELGYQHQLFESTIPAAVLAEFPLAQANLQQVRSAAFSRPFQGKLLKDWLSNIEAARAEAIRDAIRMGIVEGLTTPQIVSRIMGLRDNNFEDGLLQRSRRDVETMVRTAISHVAQGARDAFYEANGDIIASVKWLSVLDARTSSPCRLRDGLLYTNETHRPISHSVPWLAGPGRLHFNCRSNSVPILKSIEELKLQGLKIDEGTRASMDGYVPADMPYSDWFSKQSAARQDEIVGPTRGQLFRKGELNFDRFYNDKGKYLTLDELRKRDRAAFERAGLAS